MKDGEFNFISLRYWLQKHWRDAAGITIYILMSLYESWQFYLRDATGLTIIGAGATLLALIHRHPPADKPRRVAQFVVLSIPKLWICGGFVAELLRRLGIAIWLTVPLSLLLVWLIHLLEPRRVGVNMDTPQPVRSKHTLLPGLSVDTWFVKPAFDGPVVADLQVEEGSADGVRAFIMNRYTNDVRELERHGKYFIGRFWISGPFFIELRRDINLTERCCFTVELRPAEVPPTSDAGHLLRDFSQSEGLNVASIRIRVLDAQSQKKRAEQIRPDDRDAYC